MKHILKLFARTLLITTLFIAPLAQANLLISPTRVTFDDRERSEQLVLINTSEETRTYRISWQEKTSLSVGGAKILSKKEAVNFPTASNMIRYSPKQVTLKAGARQVIKLAVRRSKDLPDGEYRSYLLLSALPLKPKSSKNSEFSMQINALLSYSLPVIIRQGKIRNPIVSIKNIALTSSVQKTKSYVEKQKKDVSIKVTMNRTGLFSAVGNLIAYWQGVNDTDEKIVAQVHKLPIYPELTQANFSITWFDAPITSGRLRVTYQGIGTFSGDIIAEKVIDVTPNMFKKIE